MVCKCPFCSSKITTPYCLCFLWLIVTGGWVNAEQLGCIKLLHQAVNLSWVEAQLKCEEEGGYLAEPKTARWELSRSTYPGWRPSWSVRRNKDTWQNPGQPGENWVGQPLLGGGPAEVWGRKRILGWKRQPGENWGKDMLTKTAIAWKDYLRKKEWINDIENLANNRNCMFLIFHLFPTGW